MKAVIIAAGDGTRLRPLTNSIPKPMVRLLGLSLIERVILTARESGITEFVIVTGYLENKLKDFLKDGSKYGVKIEYVHNDKWKRPNGVSVLAARPRIRNNFILLMSDHIFESKTLLALKEMKISDKEGILAVDRNMKNILDIEDATKIKSGDNQIKAIGKDLTEFDAVDTGMFLFSPYFFEILEASIRDGHCSLTDSVRELAKKGFMRVFDIQNNFWSDIDTFDDLKYTEKKMLKRLTKLTDGPVSKWLNRPISTRISRVLVKINLSPNLISFVTFLLGVAAAGFFCFGRYTWLVIGGLLAQFSSVLDGCDGEIARLKFQKSEYGGWFDAVLDRYADGLIVFGMTYGYWIINNNFVIWIVGFGAMLGCFMTSYTASKYDAIFQKKGFPLKFRMGRDIRLFIVLLGAIFNQILITQLILGVIGNVESIRRLISLRNKV